MDINDLELDVSKKIPKIIVEAVNYFKLNEDHLKEQGIFRKAPREYDINELEKELIKKNYNAMSSCDDPHVVACIDYSIRNNHNYYQITFNSLLEESLKQNARAYLSFQIIRQDQIINPW